MGWRQAKESWIRPTRREGHGQGNRYELISWCNREEEPLVLASSSPSSSWKVNERLPAGTSEIVQDVQEIQPRRNHGPLSVVVGRRREKDGVRNL